MTPARPFAAPARPPAARVRAWIVPDVTSPHVASPNVASPNAARPPPRPEPSRPEPPHAPVPAPLASFTAADLALACDQGREEGRAEALLLALETTEARRAQALEDIAARLRDTAAATADISRRGAEALASVVVEALAASFPAIEARLGPPQVASLVRALLPSLAREPAITVRVAPSTALLVDADIARLAPDFPGRIAVEADPGLGEADLRMAWHDGAAVRDGAAIRRDVIAALAALIETVATEGRTS